MRKLVSLGLVACVLAVAGAAPAPRSIDTFGAKLHAEVGKKPGNLIYSPASIAIALAMTREGARGATAAEMDAVLGKTTGLEVRELTRSFGAKKPRSPEGAPELAIANRLFADKTTSLEKAFVEITRDGYGAPIDSVDFRTASDAARVKINTWVEQQTKDKIKDLLAKGSVTELTRLVLVNAIYLKANWATQFEPSQTKPARFTVDGGAKKQVPTMHTEAQARWGSHAGARMLDLPYVQGTGPRLGMLIVVPDKDKLEAVEAAYAKQGIAPFLAAARSTGRVAVGLPKFKIGTDFELGGALGKLGMPKAFTEGADFSGMSSTTKLWISKVIHKAWVEVNEKGTEAAAATAVVMTTDSAEPPPAHTFKADRSFLFFIHDAQGTVLFGGRVIDPTAS